MASRTMINFRTVKGKVMKMRTLADQIHNEALDMGYSRCGILALSELEDEASIQAVKEAHPWARAIVFCSWNFNYFKIPEALKGVIGKRYLFRGRHLEGTEEHEAAANLEDFMVKAGLRAEGHVPLERWALERAAVETNMGIIRKNQYFYTEEGSYGTLHAWLIDRELAWSFQDPPTPCPEHCSRCIRTCPEKALEKGYCKIRDRCTDVRTTSPSIETEPVEAGAAETGTWLYGCDICQDVCPYNLDRWEEDEDFPGQDELVALVKRDAESAWISVRLKAIDAC